MHKPSIWLIAGCLTFAAGTIARYYAYAYALAPLSTGVIFKSYPPGYLGPSPSPEAMIAWEVGLALMILGAMLVFASALCAMLKGRP